MYMINIAAESIDSYLAVIAMIYMIKYFFCREININKNIFIICGISELIIFLLKVIHINIIELPYSFPLILVLMLYNYKFKGLAKVLYIIPCLTISLMFAYLIVMAIGIFSGPVLLRDPMPDGIYNVLTYFSIIFDGTIIIFLRKKIKDNMYITLNKLDIVIMITVSIVIFLLICIMDQLKMRVVYDAILDRGIIIVIAICGIIMDSCLLISIFKSKSAVYYKSMNEINKHYMKMQLEHFDAYKKSQIETRRIKHDMKNHLICISEFLDNNKIDELKKYIYELNNGVINIDNVIKTGNMVVDSILNEKYSIMKQHNIKLSVDGRMGNETSVEPVDLCTIFANAIDNAIEGSIKENNVSKRIIKIELRDNKNFMFIIFENNMTRVKIRIKNNYITSKEDAINHGFGIINMQYAVKKYNGYFEIKEKDDIFRVEIVLPK